MYSENRKVNDLCLIVINDGAGDQCGHSYKRRCEFSVFGPAIFEMHACARTADEWLVKRGEAPAKKAEIRNAAEIIADYYARHVIERARA